MMQRGRCRFCGAELTTTFVDLGMSPLCESYVPAEKLDQMEPFYPLHAYVCTSCFLVQLEDFVGPREIFSEYAYFSSYSDSWVAHMERYADMAIGRFGLSKESTVVEVASNDGYLLQHFVRRGIPVLGIEPAANIAKVAEAKGIPTLVEFFGVALARRLAGEGRSADLIAGANVLAQVPDVNDFVEGLRLLLKPRGTVTIEFPHLEKLIEGNQFDTIYHEHFSYFSLFSATKLFEAHGLRIYDVDELPTHGGSLRIYACHADDVTKIPTPALRALGERERSQGVETVEYYRSFTEKVQETKRALLDFLIGAKRAGKTVAGYGAPGKGNTLLNYCGIRTDFVEYTVDRNVYKQNKFLPGTHIPIHAPEMIRKTKPDYLLILPWNVREEIMEQNAYVGEWGCSFVIPIPEVSVRPAGGGPA